jgi:hypothetical protein
VQAATLHPYATYLRQRRLASAANRGLEVGLLGRDHLFGVLCIPAVFSLPPYALDGLTHLQSGNRFSMWLCTTQTSQEVAPLLHPV